MRDPAELQTTEDAGRSLPSYGPAWDAAIEAGIDVTMIEHNLRLRPAERLAQMERANRFLAEVQARTVAEPIRRAQREAQLREKLEALGPERDD
jgi:hypothetical protein